MTPDVEVTISPETHARGEDPQLDAAVAEALRLARERPPPPKPARADAFAREEMHAKRAGKGGGRSKCSRCIRRRIWRRMIRSRIGIGVRVGIGRRVAAAEKETQRCETETVGEYVR